MQLNRITNVEVRMSATLLAIYLLCVRAYSQQNYSCHLSVLATRRADDLMEAFSDKSIKAIISNIGGEDSIRTLPFTDILVIRQNPKISCGFSDTTITHFA